MRLVGLFLAAMIVGGCAMKRDAETAMKDTHFIKDNSDALRDNSAHMGKNTDDLGFADSAKSESAFLKMVFGEEPVSAVAQPDGSEPNILLYSGFTMKAMWYQFWKNDEVDDLAALDRRFELSAEILLTRLKTHIPTAARVNLPNTMLIFPGTPDRNYIGVASLGAKLDFVRPEFVAVAAKSGLQNVTFYDIVMLALKNRAAVERREKFPLAVAKILQYEQEATFMIQLRHNYLPMMVVASLTDFKDRGLVGREELWRAGTQVNLSRYNPEQLREWMRWLKAARQTREELRRAGIEPEYNVSFAQILQNVDFGQKAILAQSAVELKGVQKLQREFAELYTEAVEEATGHSMSLMALPGDPGQHPAPSLMAL